MRTASLTKHMSRLLALTVVLIFSGCDADEKIVYRDRAPFNPPPDTTSGFVGYYDATTKQTTCGNCHADYQALWRTTAHANAYATLNANASKQDFCYSCHTVTGNGNVASGTKAGHDTVKTNVYYDVQCESCHGPGLEHIEGVGQGNLVRPLAKLGMTGTGNCGDCHSGAHQPFAEEWGASRHANLNVGRASDEHCASCHESRGAIEHWGFEVNFQEKATATDYQPPATCAVCHAPHGSSNPSQLRYPVTSVDPERNLCIKCHLNRSEPTLARITPHAPQGAVLLGFAGWRPPGFAYDTARIYGSHATTANPKLCAGCHVNKFTVTDQLTGDFLFNATGHLMRPIPCLDATGKPTADKTCTYTTTARNWQTCTKAGCHGDAGVAANLFTGVRNDMKFYADQLWLNSNNDGTIQATPTDGGILATLKSSRPTEWSSTDLVITPAEGAEFNARLCGEYNSPNSDNSKGVHNPFLCRALMIATINYLRTYYGLPAPPPDVQARLNILSSKSTHGMQISRTPIGN